MALSPLRCLNAPLHSACHPLTDYPDARAYPEAIGDRFFSGTLLSPRNRLTPGTCVIYDKGMSTASHPPPQTDPDVPPAGDAERWGAYIHAAFTRISISPVILHDKHSAIHLVATAAGFEGWHLLLPIEPDHLIGRVLGSLEDWLEYRLANRLSIPLLPDIDTPTLEDYEEYDSIRAYDQAKAHQGKPIPLDEAFAILDAEP